MKSSLCALLFAVTPIAFLAVDPAPVAAQTSADEMVIYRIVQGDTLIDIAQRFLSGTRHAAQLQQINEIDNPRRIPVGHILRIPRNLLAYEDVDLRVASYSGPVQISGTPAQPGRVLREGDLVETAAGGFVTFTSQGAGRISLPSNSRARLTMARRYVLGNLLDVDFEILDGRGEFNAPQLRDQERFRTRTPAAVTAVRGTEYRIGYDAEMALGTTEVTEGTVLIAADDNATLADAGFGVSARDGEVSDVETLLAAPELVDPGVIQTSEDLDFALVPLAGASSYRVQIARDAGFLDVLDETVSEGENAVLPALDDGRYFVRIRGIADSRLEGLSDTVSFRRKRLGAEASATPSPLGDGFLFGWSGEGEGQTYFAFQLWDVAQPDSLLVDDVGLSAHQLSITDLPPGRYGWRVAGVQAEQEGLLKVWGPTQELLVTQ